MRLPVDSSASSRASKTTIERSISWQISISDSRITSPSTSICAVSSASVAAVELLAGSERVRSSSFADVVPLVLGGLQPRVLLAQQHDLRLAAPPSMSAAPDGPARPPVARTGAGAGRSAGLVVVRLAGAAVAHPLHHPEPRRAPGRSAAGRRFAVTMSR